MGPCLPVLASLRIRWARRRKLRTSQRAGRVRAAHQQSALHLRAACSGTRRISLGPSVMLARQFLRRCAKTRQWLFPLPARPAMRRTAGNAKKSKRQKVKTKMEGCSMILHCLRTGRFSITNYWQRDTIEWKSSERPSIKGF